jgi:hypothetical protein
MPPAEKIARPKLSETCKKRSMRWLNIKFKNKYITLEYSPRKHQ